MIEPNYIRIKRIVEQFYRIEDMTLKRNFPRLVTARRAYVALLWQFGILNDRAIADILHMDRVSVYNMRCKASDLTTPVCGRVPDPSFAIELAGIRQYISEQIPGLVQQTELCES